MPDDIAWWNKGTGMMSTVFGSTAAEISVIRTRQRAAGRRQTWSCVSGQKTEPQRNDFSHLVPPERWNEPEVVPSIRLFEVFSGTCLCKSMFESCMIWVEFFYFLLIL